MPTQTAATPSIVSRWQVAAAIDAVCVLVFVAIGRASHDEGNALAGLATTAWPFLGGLALGWPVARAWRRPLALAPTGVVIWLVTVATGMGLRVLSGQGTAVAFIMVALTFNALTLLGWRALRLLFARRRTTAGSV